MTSPYDKLGDLLNEALEKGELNSNPKNQSNGYEKRKEKYYQFVYKSIQPYNIFNITPGICFSEIKKIYRKLLKKYHPDNVKNLPQMQKTATEKTALIVQAYKEIIEDYKNNKRINEDDLV